MANYYHLEPLYRKHSGYSSDKMADVRSPVIRVAENNQYLVVVVEVNLTVNGLIPDGTLISNFWSEFLEIADIPLHVYDMKPNGGLKDYILYGRHTVPLEKTSLYTKSFSMPQRITFKAQVRPNTDVIAPLISFDSNKSKENFFSDTKTNVSYIQQFDNTLRFNRHKQSPGFYPRIQIGNIERDYITYVLSYYQPFQRLFSYPIKLHCNVKNINNLMIENAKMMLMYADDNDETKTLEITPFIIKFGENETYDKDGKTMGYVIGIKEFVFYDHKTKSLAKRQSDVGGIFIEKDLNFTLKFEGNFVTEHSRRFFTYEEKFNAQKSEAIATRNRVMIESIKGTDMGGGDYEFVR